MYMNTKDGVTSINWRVRENGKKNNLFTKITKIRNDVKELLPEIDENKFLAMASHIRNFHYGKLYYGRQGNPKNKERKRELTEAERVLYDYYLKNGLNPSTTYCWFLACRLPSDVVEKLEKGQVSFKKALLIADNRKKSKLSSTGLLMMEEINNIIRSL